MNELKKKVKDKQYVEPPFGGQGGFQISTVEHLDFSTIEKILAENKKIALSAEAKKKIVDGRKYLDQKLKSSNAPIYGINTGFGAFHDKKIPADQLELLQHNLILSHACGTGDEIPLPIVKLMLFLKVQGLSYGNSGVRVETVQRLIDFFNNDVLPVVYEQGSLGASGDLVPLAHLSLPLLGEGEVNYNGKKQSSKDILKKFGWKPLHLQSKEGIALLNGTQFMSAYAVHILLEAFNITTLADKISTVSLEAFDGSSEPFNDLLHKARNHQGQIEVAGYIRKLLQGSELIQQKKQYVQDPYSLRCIPQVHGATRDAVNYAAMIVDDEMNAVTDNPIIFPEQDLILSGGNFHGQPLALALDFLAIALAELGNISERRTYLLVSGQRGLPPFLAVDAGVNSGFMIPQYTAASIVSQNKQLCTPASVDSILSSNGQEDHVSMGANAATKCYRVLENLKTILAIELMTSAQALEFRRPAKSSPTIEAFIADYRTKVPFLKKDRLLHSDIVKSREFLFN